MSKAQPAPQVDLAAHLYEMLGAKTDEDVLSYFARTLESAAMISVLYDPRRSPSAIVVGFSSGGTPLPIISIKSILEQALVDVIRAHALEAAQVQAASAPSLNGHAQEQSKNKE